MSQTSFLSNFRCSPTTVSFLVGSVFLTSYKNATAQKRRTFKAVVSEKFQGAHNAKSRKVRSPTCEVFGAASKHLGAQSIFLGAQAKGLLLGNSLDISFVLQRYRDVNEKPGTSLKKILAFRGLVNLIFLK